MIFFEKLYNFYSKNVTWKALAAIGTCSLAIAAYPISQAKEHYNIEKAKIELELETHKKKIEDQLKTIKIVAGDNEDYIDSTKILTEKHDIPSEYTYFEKSNIAIPTNLENLNGWELVNTKGSDLKKHIFYTPVANKPEIDNIENEGITLKTEAIIIKKGKPIDLGEDFRIYPHIFLQHVSWDDIKSYFIKSVGNCSKTVPQEFTSNFLNTENLFRLFFLEKLSEIKTLSFFELETDLIQFNNKQFIIKGYFVYSELDSTKQKTKLNFIKYGYKTNEGLYLVEYVAPFSLSTTEHKSLLYTVKGFRVIK